MNNIMNDYKLNLILSIILSTLNEHISLYQRNFKD